MAGIVGSVFFFTVFVMLVFVRKYMVEKTEMPIVLRPFAAAPVILYLALLAGGLVILIHEHIYDIRWFRSHLSEYSILQAINELSDGLVIFDNNKRIVFANRKMHDLSVSIFGQSLYYFVSFPEWIEEGFCADNVYYLPQLPCAAYYLPNGEVWQIRPLTITVDGETFHELVASDITRQYCLRREIEQENALLKKKNRLIAETAKMIIENNVKEEQLAYKMRIHDALGQCVATVSHIMQDSGDIQACANLWSEAIEGLRTYSDFKNDENEQKALNEQLLLFKQLGCTVQIEGPLPTQPLHAQVFRAAIRTTAVNAVRHAKADTLYVTTKRENLSFIIEISDNGSVFPKSMEEGGGLSSLRQKIESIHGEIEIVLEKGVKVHIILPPPTKNEIFVNN